MNIQKAASVASCGVPTEEQLALIHAQTKRELRAQEVYVFRVRLCDDQVDRDAERFDTAALPVLAKLFVGKTGISDHEWSAERQVARIFAAEVCEEAGVHYISAQCYMLRNEKNASLIEDIEGGIKREVSVGCAVARTVCSVCGKVYGACEHRKGVTYDGKLCVAVLCEPTDAYEFSFVAVPAQREAGVQKGLKGGGRMSLQEYVEKSADPIHAEHLKKLQEQAQLGKQCFAQLLSETVSLALLLDFGAQETILQKSFGTLSFDELLSLKKSMAQKAAALFPGQTQLPEANLAFADADAAFMI